MNHTRTIARYATITVVVTFALVACDNATDPTDAGVEQSVLSTSSAANTSVEPTTGEEPATTPVVDTTTQS